MGSPTQITVSVDSTEYCRYEPALDTITVSVVVQGGGIYSNEEVLVELIKARRSRDAVVATSTLTFTANADIQEGVVTFYLPDIVDQDLISLIRFGKYFIRATSVSDDSIIGESPEFDLRIVSVEALKRDFLFGISMAATEVRAPRFQPQSISGVTITETSQTHPFGFGSLQYIYNTTNTTNATAAIGSGVDGTVTITADTALAGSVGNSIAVRVLVPSGTSALSASYASGLLTINLDVTAGSPNAGANTATLVAAAISALADFTAVASGSGATPLATASGPTLFSGGATSVLRQISWNGGPVVSIGSSGTFILRRGETGPGSGFPSSASDFIVVKVNSALLPTSDVTEEILIDKKKIDDDALSEYLNRAISWIENIVIAGYIEPTNVVTDRDPTTIQFAAGINAPTPIFADTDYDFIVSPLTYFVPKTAGDWVGIQTQFPQVLRVDSLFGAIANTRVIDIDLEWIEVAEQSGFIQLVPFNQEIAFDFVGLIWVNAIRGAAELPNFWHFNMIAGLRDCPPELREVIAKKAAIDALTALGMALRPGVGSLSLSRDGVSESISYLNTAKYGIYTGTINAYKEWIDDQLRQIKGKYRGPTLAVV